MTGDPAGTPRFGRFALDDVLGAGGMGVVHVATDTTLGRRVALKLMSGPLAERPEFRERFLREAEVLTSLDSPHVIQVYDHGDQDGTLWIATPFVAGGDLAALVRRRGPLPGAVAADLCRQVADGLTAAHARGVVHRDVKPANVLVRDPDAARPEALLCDFGVASTGVEGLTATGAVTGTYAYLAPEYAHGVRPGPAGDVYALGCLLWACLTGAPPYGGSALEVALGHRDGPLPRLEGSDPWLGRINDVLARCLAKDPADRYTSAAAARDDLADLARTAPGTGPYAGPLAAAASAATVPSSGGVQAAPTVARLPPRPEGPGRRGTHEGRPGSGRRSRVLTAVAGTGALLLVAGLLGWTVLSGEESTGGEDPVAGGSSQDATGGTGEEQPDPLDPSDPSDPSDLVAGVRGDLTGDGRGDLLIRDWDRRPERLALLTSDGQAFTTPGVVAQGVFQAVSGDVDGDGAEEVVSVDVLGDTATVTVTDVDGRGVPQAPVEHELRIVDGPADIGTPLLGDIDGDGRADLLVTSVRGASGGRLEVWAALSEGDGFGDLRRLFAEDRRFGLVAPADVDGDGVDEVVVAGDDTLEVLRPSASGDELTTTGEVALDVFLLNPAVGDFDGDGRAEVVVATGPGGDAVSLLRWDGEGWDDEAWLASGGEAIDLGAPSPASGVVDVDGDGVDDLVRFQRSSDGADTIWVLRGRTKGFEAPRAWGTYACGCAELYDPTGSYPPG